MNRLVTFGWGIAERDSNGVIYTSSAVMAYFEELLDYFDSVDIFIPLVSTPHNFSCAFKDERLRAYGYGRSKFSFVRSYIPLLRAASGAHVFIFIPSASRLAPIFSLLKNRAKSMPLYVADDPFAFVGHLSLSFIPGYDLLYKKSVKKFLSLSDPVFVAGKLVGDLCQPYSKNVHESLSEGHLPLQVKSTRNNSQDNQVTNKTGEYTVLFLNRVVFNKGVIELLRGFEMLCARRSESLRLIYTGDGDALKELKVLAEQSPIKEFIEFSGWVDNQEKLEEIWQQADVYILPSTHTEGRPRGIEEAIARRVPCIASKVGGVASEHGNGQVCLIEPGSPQAISDALEKVLFNEAYRLELLNKAEKRRRWLLDNGSAAKQHARLILREEQI